MEAIANCITRLPQPEREEILSNPYDKEIINKYIVQDIYTEEINKVSTKALADFLQHLTPILSDEQKEKIAAIFPN